jgi:hypothetical protein
MVENAVMDKAGELFGKKYFGIPFPVILFGVAGTAYVIRRMVKGNESAKTVDSAPVPEGYAMDVSGNKFASAYTGQAGGVPFGSGSLTSASASGVSVATPPTEIDNVPWTRRAAEKLAAGNMWNSVEVQRALTAYITGQNLDAKQTAIVNQAIKMEGQPPIPLAPGGTSASSQLVGLVNPTGTVGIFGKYSDGSLVWLGDGNQTANTIANMKANGIDTNVTQLPINDPIWQRADVNLNPTSQKSLYYLWAEKWASYIEPDSYYGRQSIVTNPEANAAAEGLWQKSYAYLTSVGQGVWTEKGKPETATNREWGSTAFQTAFPGGIV